MNVKFKLRPSGRPNKYGRIQIIARIMYDGRRVDIYTGYSAHPEKEWNKKSDKLRSSHPDYNLIKVRFAEIQTKATEIYTEASLKNETIEPKLFRSQFRNNIKGSGSFYDLFEHWINAMKASKNPRTILNYSATLKFLKDYSEAKNITLSISKINSDFFEKLVSYAYSDRKVKPNYLFSIIKVLKVFMKWAQEKKFHNNDDYKAFKVTLYPISIIYLTFDELQRLYAHPFTGDYCFARDIFCLMCTTGLRISDAIRLGPEHIKESQIKIQSIKGNESLGIPLNKYSEEILTRYRFCLPRIHPQEINTIIKDCCRIAGIDELTEIKSYPGGKLKISQEPKYKLISNHAGRRTFITNSVKFGMQTNILMDMVGHKKMSTMKRYLKIADDTKTDAMKGAWG